MENIQMGKTFRNERFDDWNSHSRDGKKRKKSSLNDRRSKRKLKNSRREELFNIPASSELEKSDA